MIDDCSQTPLADETPFESDLPVRFVRHESNAGPAASVVDGIRHSRFPLVTTLNHDDMWEPQFLERLGTQLDAHPKAVFAFCDHGIMRAGGEHDEALSLAQSRRFGRAELAGGVLQGVKLYEAAILRKSVAASSFMLCRREALFLELIGTGEDMWDYFLAVGACMAGDTAVYLPERLGWYRLSPTMLSTTWVEPEKQLKLARPQIAILLVTLRFRAFAPLRGALRRRLLLSMRHALAAALRTKRPAAIAVLTMRIVEGIRDAGRLRAIRPEHAPGN